MYRTIIKLKKDISAEQLSILTERIIDNFNNRAGKIDNHSTDPYEFVFEGEGEAVFECIHLAIANLTEPEFMNFVNVWDWIDENEPEYGSVIDSYKKYYERLEE